MKLGIQKKVVISIVIVGMLPLLVGLYLTYLDGKATRRNSIGASFQEMAKETAGVVLCYTAGRRRKACPLRFS